MLDTYKASSAYEAAITTLPQSLENLSGTAKKLYLALQLAAEKVKESRGYHFKTSQVTFFCPVEAVALAIGVCRKTVYNRLPELVEKGLVANRGHYCTYRGSTRSDGSLWSVRLNPETPGRAKIDHDWLSKQGYRDLGADIEANRTAWNLTQSNSNKEKQVRIEYILAFALPPTNLDSITFDCVNGVSGLETVLDLPYTSVEAKNEVVDKTAKAISSILGSPQSSLMFYRWLLWCLLRLEQQNKNRFYQVFLMLQRAAIEKRENSCRNAGGLFVSWLKQSPIWEELKGVPPMRIGNKPKSMP